MERAKRLLIEGHPRDVLRSRVEAWHEADSIRAYCDAVETLHGTSAPTLAPPSGSSSPANTQTAPNDYRECLPTQKSRPRA